MLKNSNYHMSNFENNLEKSNILPEIVQYFSEVTFIDSIKIPYDRPCINEILSAISSINIVSTKLIKTDIAKSYDGKNLSGYKLLVELNLKEKIKYLSLEQKKSIQILDLENKTKNIFITVPSIINNIKIEDLIRRNLFAINSYIEDIYCTKVDNRNILKALSLIVEIKFL